MKVTKTSWHYRFNDFWNDSAQDLPNNLCNYFWLTIINLLKTFGTSVIILVSVLFSLSPLLLFKYSFVDCGPYPAMALIAEIIFGTIFIYQFIMDKSSFARLFVNYLKSKINKFCPKLEFYDKGSE